MSDKLLINAENFCSEMMKGDYCETSDAVALVSALIGRLKKSDKQIEQLQKDKAELVEVLKEIKNKEYPPQGWELSDMVCDMKDIADEILQDRGE